MNHGIRRDGAGDVSDEFGLLDLLVFIARYKKFIVSSTLAAMLLALLFSVVRPDTYSASTRLLPSPKLQFSSLLLASEFGVAAINRRIFKGGKPASGLYTGILKSNQIVDTLIGKFDLKQVYGVQSQEEARRELRANTTFVAGKNGFIEITVRDTSQDRVALLANAYIAELNNLARQVATRSATQQREFYARELVTAQNNVTVAEAALTQAMARQGMDNGVANAATLAATMARLRTRISEQQVRLDAASAFATPQNPNYVRLKQERDSLQAGLDQLTNGTNAAAPEDIATTGGLQSIQLARTLADARQLEEAVAIQHELARMDVTEDLAATQVLDAGVKPEYRVDPRRLLRVWQAAVAAMIAATAVCFVAEARRQRLLLGQAK